MSTSQKSSEKGLIKKTFGWLFEPTIPVYEDEPTRIQKRKSTQPVSKGSKQKKSAATLKIARKGSGKKNKVTLTELPLEEQGERLGYIDKHGVVRMKADGREIGQLSDDEWDDDANEILGRHIARFRDHEKQVSELVENADKIPQSRFEEIAILEEKLKTDAGLGDPSAMLDQIAKVKETVEANTNKLKSEKVKVLQQADKLPFIADNGEVDWRKSDAALADITDAWRATGDVGVEAQNTLDLRYNKTIESYSNRKEKFFTDFQGNAKAKDKLLRRAQGLIQLKDTETATDEFESIERQWRSVGPADVEEDAMLRAKFNMARKEFEDRNAGTIAAIEERKAALAKTKSTMAQEIQALGKISNPRVLSQSVRQQRDKLSEIESTLGSDGETKMVAHQLDLQAERAAELQRQADVETKRDAAKTEQIHARLSVLAKADQNGISWKDADQELKDLREEASSLQRLQRENRQSLDQAFSDARRDFNANRTAFFDKMDAERATNSARKRALINDLPFYKNGASAAELVAHLNNSMENWKKAGPAERDENEALWDEYRKVRSSLFEKVDELRDLEKDDFVARLAYSFEKKKEELYRLESEVGREAMLAEETTDKEKAKKLRSVVERKKLRIEGMQKEILDIQRKLSKMSPAARQDAAATTAETAEQTG